MKAFSRKYHDVLMLLEGEGEGPGDLWKKYFLDGRVQSCQAIITFEPYDPKKLR